MGRFRIGTSQLLTAYSSQRAQIVTGVILAVFALVQLPELYVRWGIVQQSEFFRRHRSLAAEYAVASSIAAYNGAVLIPFLAYQLVCFLVLLLGDAQARGVRALTWVYRRMEFDYTILLVVSLVECVAAIKTLLLPDVVCQASLGQPEQVCVASTWELQDRLPLSDPVAMLGAFVISGEVMMIGTRCVFGYGRRCPGYAG